MRNNSYSQAHVLSPGPAVRPSVRFNIARILVFSRVLIITNSLFCFRALSSQALEREDNRRRSSHIAAKTENRGGAPARQRRRKQRQFTNRLSLAMRTHPAAPTLLSQTGTGGFNVIVWYFAAAAGEISDNASCRISDDSAVAVASSGGSGGDTAPIRQRCNQPGVAASTIAAASNSDLSYPRTSPVLSGPAAASVAARNQKAAAHVVRVAAAGLAYRLPRAALDTVRRRRRRAWARAEPLYGRWRYLFAQEI